MTKPRISLPDLELLSAYLDGQLNPHRKAALETHLRTDPVLRKHLDELRNTRQMLRSLPRLRAPHNFTLSAQAAGKRSPSRLPALFGAVSALSSALLILLVIGSLILGNTAQPASLVEGEQIVTTDVEMVEVVVAVEAPTEKQDASATPEPILEGALPAEEESSRIAESTPEVGLVPPAAEMLAAPPPTAYPIPEEGLTLDIQAEAETTQTPYPVPVPLRETTPADQPNLPSDSPILTTLLAGEIALAGVALLAGIIALLLMIRYRR